MITITEYMVQDHLRLAELLAMSTHNEASFDRESFEEFRRGLLRHIGIEEKLIFREARLRRKGEPLPLAHRLRIDHAALTSLLVPTPNAALVHEIRRILDVHDVVEEAENGVYAQCEELLGSDSAAFVEKAAAFPTPPLNAHFDGTKERRVYRTAAEALAMAERIAPPKRTEVDQ